MISGEPAAAGSILEVDDSDAVTFWALAKLLSIKAEAEGPAAKEKAPEPAPKKNHHSQED